MGFGAILDHLEATFIHCGPFEKVEKNSIFDVILVDFGPFWAISGLAAHAAQNGQKMAFFGTQKGD